MTTKIQGCTLYVHDTDPSWTPCVHAVEYTVEAGANGFGELRASMHPIWGPETAATIIRRFSSRYEPHMLAVFNAAERNDSTTHRDDLNAHLAACRRELATGARDLLSALERGHIPTANEARISAESILEYTTATDLAEAAGRMLDVAPPGMR